MTSSAGITATVTTAVASQHRRVVGCQHIIARVPAMCSLPISVFLFILFTLFTIANFLLAVLFAVLVIPILIFGIGVAARTAGVVIPASVVSCIGGISGPSIGLIVSRIAGIGTRPASSFRHRCSSFGWSAFRTFGILRIANRTAFLISVARLLMMFMHTTAVRARCALVTSCVIGDERRYFVLCLRTCIGISSTVCWVQETGPGIVRADSVTVTDLGVSRKAVGLIQCTKGTGQILEFAGQRLLKASQSSNQPQHQDCPHQHDLCRQNGPVFAE